MSIYSTLGRMGRSAGRSAEALGRSTLVNGSRMAESSARYAGRRVQGTAGFAARRAGGGTATMLARGASSKKIMVPAAIGMMGIGMTSGMINGVVNKGDQISQTVVGNPDFFSSLPQAAVKSVFNEQYTRASDPRRGVPDGYNDYPTRPQYLYGRSYNSNASGGVVFGMYNQRRK